MVNLIEKRTARQIDEKVIGNECFGRTGKEVRKGRGIPTDGITIPICGM
jgi:hypothetical protein